MTADLGTTLAAVPGAGAYLSGTRLRVHGARVRPVVGALIESHPDRPAGSDAVASHTRETVKYFALPLRLRRPSPRATAMHQLVQIGRDARWESPRPTNAHPMTVPVLPEAWDAQGPSRGSAAPTTRQRRADARSPLAERDRAARRDDTGGGPFKHSTVRRPASMCLRRSRREEGRETA